MPATKEQLTNFYFDDSIKLIIHLESVIKDLTKFFNNSNPNEYQAIGKALEKTMDFYFYHQNHCPSQEVKDLINNRLDLL